MLMQVSNTVFRYISSVFRVTYKSNQLLAPEMAYKTSESSKLYPKHFTRYTAQLMLYYLHREQLYTPSNLVFYTQRR
jgi:hypothetical protein